MEIKARTIEIFLPNGNPSSIQKARNTISPLKAIMFNIAELENLKTDFENTNGVYVLLGDEDVIDQVYIGETNDLYKRFKNHRSNKEFWNIGYAIINETGSFDKAHLTYLESLMISKARECQNSDVQNDNAGQPSRITDEKKFDCLNYFQTIVLLVETLGLNIFKVNLNKTSVQSSDTTVFKYSGKDKSWDASCIVIDNTYVVLKGSKMRKEVVESLKAKYTKSFVLSSRNKLISNTNLIEDKGDYYLFKQDYAFKSPSAAAGTISGRHDNGWLKWKNSVTGETLEDVIGR